MTSLRRTAATALIASGSLLLAGCSPATWQGVATGLAAAGSAQVPSATVKLMIFGGANHDTYLGCLTCPEYATDSVRNQYGSYGSAYSSTSIFNRYGQFGSPYSSYSACNPYASDPPVIVDGIGAFYGRLTLNRYHRQALRTPELLAWLAAVCAG